MFFFAFEQGELASTELSKLLALKNDELRSQISAKLMVTVHCAGIRNATRILRMQWHYQDIANKIKT